MQKSGLASLAMFFCDFRDDKKRDLRGILSSLLAQLCRQSDSYCDLLSEFYSKYDNGSQDPSDDALCQCLVNLLKFLGQAPVYLIIAALNCCPSTSNLPSPREVVLSFVEELVELRLTNLRICITSRPEIDIKAILEPLTFSPVSIHNERGHKEDITNYIRSVINMYSNNRRWKQEDKQLVIEVLTECADGV